MTLKARVRRLAVRGSRGLNIAFCVRAKGMQTISVNFFDAKKRDNTTPTSPARVQDDIWRTVGFAGEDFHHLLWQVKVHVDFFDYYLALFIKFFYIKFRVEHQI
mgnify:CR=1 FL=1